MRIGHTVSVWPIPYLAVVLILVVLILVVLVVVLILLILLLVLVLVFHFYILQVFVLRLSRYSSFPRFSGFILWLENQADQKTAEDSSGNTAGRCFQASG